MQLKVVSVSEDDGPPEIVRQVIASDGNRISPLRYPVRSAKSYRLILAFFGAVTTACLVVFAVGAFFSPEGIGWVSSIGDNEGRKDSLFQDPLIVNLPGVAMHVPDSPPLNPAAEKDFLFFCWFMVRRNVAVDDRLVFVGKYDPLSKTRPGYSIGLEGSVEGARPIVYWQDENGGGRWYTFSEANIRPREWYLLVLSFRDRRYLGVHLVSAAERQTVHRLGGYDLEGAVVPESPAELVVGAFGPSKFRGKIGPFGVIRKRQLSRELDSLIPEIAAAPESIPPSLDAINVALWATPTKDISRSKLPVVIQGKVKGARVEEESAAGNEG